MRSNNFGVGLPPRGKNEPTWPLKRTLLADVALKPWTEDIEQSWDVFRCLLTHTSAWRTGRPQHLTRLAHCLQICLSSAQLA